MSVYDLNGAVLIDGNTHSISGEMEAGTVQKTYGYISNADSFTNTRSEKTYKIIGGTPGDISVEIEGLLSESNTVTMYFFDASGQYLGYTDKTGSTPSFPVMSNAKYIKLGIANSSSVKRKERFVIKSGFPIIEVGNPNIINSGVGSSLAFCYEVTPKAMTTGRLLLPPNYSMDGEKVPLIVYAHGSGAMLSWNAQLGSVLDGSTQLTYLPYLQYLANEGFAIFDCYPWTTEKTIPESTWSPFMIPQHKAAYLQGIKYVCSRFNVDIDRVSVLCKSQGGHFGQWAIVQREFPFKAVALFAPSCGLSGTLFFNAKCREALAEYVDFRGTSEEIAAFISSGKYYADDQATRALVRSFVAKNKDKLIAMSPMNQGITNGTQDDIIEGAIVPTYTLPQWMVDIGLPTKPEGSQPLFSMAENPDYVRVASIPSKFWAAFDDDQSSGYTHYACYHWLANGSSDTDFREMPIGTGGHHSMDTDQNALKSSGSTALGITYTDIPTAYVEVAEFIRSRCGG